MNVVLFGLGIACRSFLDKYDASRSDYNIKFVVDNNSDLWGTDYNGIPIFSADKLLTTYPNDVEGVIITSMHSKTICMQINQLKKIQIYNIGFMRIYNMLNNSSMSTIYDVRWYILEKQSIIPTLEVHLANHCNLKCKGCTHFSNLFEESFCDIDEFKNDLKQISKHSNLITLTLLGGEPLLNPNIIEYVNYARKVFPTTEILIMTNGLLIPKQPKEFFDCLKENDVCIMISPYKPTVKIIDQIFEILNEYNVKWLYQTTFDTVVDKFLVNLSMSGQTNPKESMAICQPVIPQIAHGRLYICVPEAYIDKYIEYFSLSQKINNPGIDIYDSNLDWLNITEKLITPVDMCRYCSTELREFDWEISQNPSVNDWIAKEEDFIK